ncbi:hypothetical protein [Bdellovibrio sp. HCB274]|uniref:hypothetical protein n=1 Tax=Bdellovibrio sp. HCB274 TaxID=3394361 RepID=UPI0039B45A4B
MTKSPADYTSAGVVTITGAVTLNPGTYTFTTLIVNSTLTINGDTTTNSGVIIIADTITVGSSGSINANGKGYAGNAGIGKGAESMGGCHGGFGGYGEELGAFCTPYAVSLEPTTLGSGGGIGYAGNTPGAGGGAIKLQVSGTLTVTGNISANGTNPSGSSGTMAGGGAGGSVWIQAGTLAGAGPIRANGGNGVSGSSGGGGGGAVAVYYNASTYSGVISASGGTSSAMFMGYAGSALLIDSLNNDLYVNSPSMVANGTYSFRNIYVDAAGSLSVQGLGSKKNLGSGKGICNGSDCSGGSYGGRGGAGGSATNVVNSGLTYGSTLEPQDTGSGGGVPATIYSFGGEGGGAIKLVATGTITINGPIDADGMPAQVSAGTGKPAGGSGGSVWIVAGNVAGNGTIQAVGGTGVGGAGGGGRIAIHYSGTLSSSLTYNVNFGSGLSPNATVGSVVIVDTANNNLYFPVTSTLTSGTYTYNNITIAPSAKVSSIDGGIAGTGDRPGASDSGTAGGGGGGHGGAGGGGYGSTSGGGTIGSATAPIALGSGGGSNTSGRGHGGSGGGALRFIISNSLTIGAGGNLNADGSSYIVGYGGGGSGGSIWITAKNVFSVTSGISAKGGNGDPAKGGGGGGGRIAIYCTGSYSGTLSVTAGTGYANGGAGSTKVECTAPPTWFFRGY